MMTRLQFNDEGKVYNNLKIIAKVAPRITPSGNKETRVEVECLACGTHKEVAWSKVKSGHTKSCGCTAEARRKDITGQRFGSLVAIESTGVKKKGSLLWRCKCDCGNTKDVSVSGLGSGQYQSCGCMQHKGSPRDLKGQTFGRLTAIEPVGTNKSRQYLWRCDCSCGNTHTVTGTSLIEGQTKSCGCYAAEVHGKASITHGMSHTPEERVDVNGDYSPDNCVWADVFVQGFNTRMSTSNTSGVTGVCETKDGKWQAYIGYMGRNVHLGYFIKFEDAVSVRKEAELKYHGKNK